MASPSAALTRVVSNMDTATNTPRAVVAQPLCRKCNVNVVSFRPLGARRRIRFGGSVNEVFMSVTLFQVECVLAKQVHAGRLRQCWATASIRRSDVTVPSASPFSKSPSLTPMRLVMCAKQTTGFCFDRANA